MEEEAFLSAPGDVKGAMSAIRTRPRVKLSKEGLKAKATHKATVKVQKWLCCCRLGLQ